MDLYGTTTLSRVVDNLNKPAHFITRTFFPSIQTEQNSEEIHFDVDESRPRITPFVHPLTAGRVVADRGYATKSFKPAYAKDLRVLQPNAPLKRMPGEQITGDLDPMERRRRQLVRSLEDQLDMLDRREEVMAAEILCTGKVVVVGDDYPAVTVDFGRDPSLTKALVGGARWGESGVKVLRNVETWAGEIQNKAGVAAKTLVMDPDAWMLFEDDDKVNKLLDRRAWAGIPGMAEDPSVYFGDDPEQKFRFKGVIGDFEVWVGNDIYVDPLDNQVKNLLPQYSVIVGSRPNPNTGRGGVEGVRCYGNILDEEANYTATRYFAKSWIEKNPAVRQLLLQAAPLPVLYRPNGCAYIKVR